MKASHIIMIVLLFAGCGEERRSDLTPIQQEVVKAVHEVDSMRSARAASITSGELVDFDTFARVCQPVGRRIIDIAQEKGWQFRQISERNRNPANGLDSSLVDVYRQFQEESDLDSLWQATDGGVRYFHRITVEASCLHCHGPVDTRPRFVIERYPDDRAFDFEVGDLRGLYAVTVPASAGSEAGG